MIHSEVIKQQKSESLYEADIILSGDIFYISS